jgi:hypothetical protein
VHAQTARGSYKNAGNDNIEGDDGNAGDEDAKKPKPKSTKKKKQGVKHKFLHESLVDNVALKPDSDWYHFFNNIQNSHHRCGHYNISPLTHKLLHQWMQDQRQKYFDNTLKDTN